MSIDNEHNLAYRKYYEAVSHYDNRNLDVSYEMFRALKLNYAGYFEDGLLEWRIGACCAELARGNISKAEEAVNYLKASHGLLDRQKHPYKTMCMFYDLAMTLWSLGRTKETSAIAMEGLSYLDEFEPAESDSKYWEAHLANRVTYLLLVGNCYFAESNYDKALEYYFRAESENNRRVERSQLAARIHLQIGRAYHYSENDVLAEGRFIQIEPRDLPVESLHHYHFVLLRLYLGQHKFELAVEQFERLEALGISSEDEMVAYHFGGVAYYALRNYEKALSLITKSQELHNPDWVGQRNEEYLRRVKEKMA